MLLHWELIWLTEDTSDVKVSDGRSSDINKSKMTKKRQNRKGGNKDKDYLIQFSTNKVLNF